MYYRLTHLKYQVIFHNIHYQTLKKHTHRYFCCWFFLSTQGLRLQIFLFCNHASNPSALPWIVRFLVSKRISLLAISIAIHYFLIASFMLQHRNAITVRKKKCIKLLDYSAIESFSFSCERKWASANKVSRHISFSFRPYLFDQR